MKFIQMFIFICGCTTVLSLCSECNDFCIRNVQHDNDVSIRGTCGHNTDKCTCYETYNNIHTLSNDCYDSCDSLCSTFYRSPITAITVESGINDITQCQCFRETQFCINDDCEALCVSQFGDFMDNVKGLCNSQNYCQCYMDLSNNNCDNCRCLYKPCYCKLFCSHGQKRLNLN